LNQFVQAFVDTVRSWDGVEGHAHRFGGTEFRLGKVEIGHIHHGKGMVDIPFTVKIREALVSEGKTGVHHLLQDSGWTTFYIRSEADLQQALWLMRLSYLHKVSRRHPIDPDEIKAMNLADAVRLAAFPQR